VQVLARVVAQEQRRRDGAVDARGERDEDCGPLAEGCAVREWGAHALVGRGGARGTGYAGVLPDVE